MRCRDARIEDAAAIGRIHIAAWRAAYQGLMPPAFLAALDPVRAAERWERRLRAGGSVLLVESSGDAAGFCLHGLSRDEDASLSTGEILAINLDPAYWRRGLGRTLLREAMARLTTAGFSEATLWVLRGNDRARRFYEALGWQFDGTERVLTELTGSPLHEVRYRADLTSRSACRAGVGPCPRGRT